MDEKTGIDGAGKSKRTVAISKSKLKRAGGSRLMQRSDSVERYFPVVDQPGDDKEGNVPYYCLPPPPLGTALPFFHSLPDPNLCSCPPLSTFTTEPVVNVKDTHKGSSANFDTVAGLKLLPPKNVEDDESDNDTEDPDGSDNDTGNEVGERWPPEKYESSCKEYLKYEHRVDYYDRRWTVPHYEKGQV